MPHITDLENWRRKLIREFKGAKVKDVQVDGSLLLNLSSTDLKNKLYSKALVNVERFGKLMAFSFGKEFLVVQLSSDAWFDNTTDGKLNEAKLIISFEDDKEFVLFDSSNRTKLEYVRVRLQNSRLISEIGEDVTRFNSRQFTDRIFTSKRRTITIKKYLTDQLELSGLNEIFVDEILFLSKIRPDSTLGKLENVQLAEIYKNMFNTVNFALKKVFEKNNFGINNPTWFKTYKRHRKPCAVCGKKVSMRKLAGINSTFCSRCQKSYC